MPDEKAVIIKGISVKEVKRMVPARIKMASYIIVDAIIAIVATYKMLAKFAIG